MTPPRPRIERRPASEAHVEEAPAGVEETAGPVGETPGAEGWYRQLHQRFDDLDLPADADDALFRPRPDIERHLWLSVRGLGRVITWVYGASEVDQQGWATTSFVQVDAYASNRERASVLADQCRRVVKALPWIPWDEGVVAAVDVTDGPRWEPDENGGPRYVTRFAIVFHPRQVRVLT